MNGFPGVNPWTGVFLSGLHSGLPVVLAQSYSFLFQGPINCFALSRPVKSFAALLRAIKQECHNDNDSVTDQLSQLRILMPGGWELRSADMCLFLPPAV